ncbi:GL21307 [Drosophila persimilis]|uniref:GL21307 n=1 Tax=Drosophila persimilis TaxID=7234 RepID=B4HC69_DROPE|nr:GL21307 [Drosophila persimilis]
MSENKGIMLAKSVQKHAGRAKEKVSAKRCPFEGSSQLQLQAQVQLQLQLQLQVAYGAATPTHAKDFLRKLWTSSSGRRRLTRPSLARPVLRRRVSILVHRFPGSAERLRRFHVPHQQAIRNRDRVHCSWADSLVPSAAPRPQPAPMSPGEEFVLAKPGAFEPCNG